MHKILVVEDDKALRDVLTYNLKREGYEVLTAENGAEALETARQKKPDLILLDVLLPELDGYEVCRILRKESSVPIIMLTALDQETNKVMGFELGADDYVTKPFSIKELLARVRARLRKHEAGQAAALKIGDIEIDESRHTVRIGPRAIELTPKEFELLALLARNKGIVFSRDQLLRQVWGYDFTGDSRTVDVHMSWLRGKIEENPQQPRHLVTVHGVGYKFEE
jgi:DNA-binding response OmpR family regulator